MTLLFLSFEFMQGNLAAANIIMSNGMKLLSNSFETLRHSVPGETQKPSDSKSHGLGEIDHLLPSLSIMSGYEYSCNSQHVLFASMHCIARVDIFPLKPQNMAELTTQWGNFFLRCMLFVTHVRVHGLHKLSSDKSAPEMCQQQLIRYLRAWEPILRKGRRELGTSDKDQFSHLVFSVQRNLCMVLVNCCADEAGTLCDEFDQEVEAITDLCGSYITAQSVKNFQFMFNGGYISSALAVMVSKCRNLKYGRKQSDY
jgi:hypothetical protein